MKTQLWSHSTEMFLFPKLVFTFWISKRKTFGNELLSKQYFFFPSRSHIKWDIFKLTIKAFRFRGKKTPDALVLVWQANGLQCWGCIKIAKKTIIRRNIWNFFFNDSKKKMLHIRRWVCKRWQTKNIHHCISNFPGASSISNLSHRF